MKPMIEQLVVGYARELDQFWCQASGSVTLITAGDSRILVDCGDPWNGQTIVDELRKRSLNPADINHVVVTHGHSDHCGNLNLFQNSKIIMDGDLGVKGSRYSKFNEHEDIAEGVLVCAMPGHTAHDLVVIVEGSELGTVYIAGDC